MTEHPYCCDRFASWADDEDFRQNDDGSLTAELEDGYQFGPIRFCPFCGALVDADGVEAPLKYDQPTAQMDCNWLRYALRNGWPIKWRDGTPLRVSDVKEGETYIVDTATHIARLVDDA